MFTTAAENYSFDGGVTWQSNPTLNNLIAGTYNLRIRNSEGCASFSTTATVSTLVDVLDDPVFTTVPSSCANDGSITINTPAAQYSFDGGTTWGTSNTATLLPASTYNIQIRSTLGCESAPLQVTIGLESVPAPQTFGVELCINSPSQALTATGVNLLWYTSATGGAGSATPPVPSTGVAGTEAYYVFQTINGCESGRSVINVTVIPAPLPPVFSGETEFCQFSSTPP